MSLSGSGREGRARPNAPQARRVAVELPRGGYERHVVPSEGVHSSAWQAAPRVAAI